MKTSNSMLAKVRDMFCPRIMPNGRIIFLGLSETPAMLIVVDALSGLGVKLDDGRCPPNAVIHYSERGWIILLDIAECNGPIDSDRRAELAMTFASCKAQLVFVTAFRDMEEFSQRQDALAWGTSAWMATTPDHLVIFDGQRLIGPYAHREDIAEVKYGD